MRRIAVLALLLVALGGCGATKYASETWTGGYSQSEVRPGVWRIGFSGNGYTSRETVQTYWLYHAAQVTREHGYDGFEIVSQISLASDERGGNGSAPAAGFTPVQYIEKASIFADIRLLKKPFKPNPPRVFDAKALSDALEPHLEQMCGDNVCPHAHLYLLPPI